MKYYFAVDESSLPPLGDTIFKKERKKLSVALEAQFGLQMFEDRKHQFSEFFSDDEQDVDIYLSALLTTLDKVAAAREDKDYDKQELLLQLLTICCSRPSLIFGNHPYCKTDDKQPINFDDRSKALRREWSKYHQDIGEMYDGLMQYQVQEQILEAYWDRSKEKLNHSPAPRQKAIINGELLSKIEGKIEEVCINYCEQIESIVGPAASMADPTQIKVSSNLIEHCTQAARLFPLAPVLIIRDIQNKLVNDKRNRGPTLLDGDKNPFWIKQDLSREQRRQVSVLTKMYCQRLRSIWRIITDGKEDALQTILQEEADELQMNTFFMKNVKEPSAKNRNATPFSVLTVSYDSITYWLALAYRLNRAQTVKLFEKMGSFAWGAEGVIKILSDEDLPPELEKPLTNIRKLLKADNYFLANDVDDLKKQIQKKCEKILDALPISSKNKSFLSVWNSIEQFFYLTDIMPLTMLQSKAVQFDIGLEDLLPSFIQSYDKKLKSELKKYKKKKVIKSLLGCNKIGEEFATTFKPKFDKRMTWSQARDFLLNCVVPVKELLEQKESKRYTRQIEELRRIWALDAEIVSALSGDISMQTIVFQATLSTALELLEIEVINAMLTLSPCLVVLKHTQPMDDLGGNTPE